MKIVKVTLSGTLNKIALYSLHMPSKVNQDLYAMYTVNGFNYVYDGLHDDVFVFKEPLIVKVDNTIVDGVKIIHESFDIEESRPYMYLGRVYECAYSVNINIYLDDNEEFKKENLYICKCMDTESSFNGYIHPTDIIYNNKGFSNYDDLDIILSAYEFKEIGTKEFFSWQPILP